MYRLRKLDNDIDYNNKEVCDPYDLDVVMRQDVWQEYKITAQDEDVSEYLCLPNLVGQDKMDFIPYNVELQIYNLPSYPHTINGTGGVESLYACIGGRKPSRNSLLPWSRGDWTPWSYHVMSDVSRGHRGYRSGYKAIVYRNNVVWMEGWRSTRDAARLWCEMTIESFEKNFNGTDLTRRDWEKRLIGSHFGYENEVYTIESIVEKQAAIVTVEPYESLIDEDSLGGGESLKLEMNSTSIDWFPSVTQQHISRSELLREKRKQEMLIKKATES